MFPVGVLSLRVIEEFHPESVVAGDFLGGRRSCTTAALPLLSFISHYL
jgi:hypothetical protein